MDFGSRGAHALWAVQRGVGGGIPALMVGEPNPYAVRVETEGTAVGGARTQRLNTFLFTTGGRGRGGRGGRGRGRTGSTTPAAEVETGEVAPPPPPEAEAEGDGTAGAGDGGGAGSRLLSFSPPRGWSRGDDGRSLGRVGPQDTVVAAWAIIRQRCLRRTASTWATRSALVLGMAPSCCIGGRHRRWVFRGTDCCSAVDAERSLGNLKLFRLRR